MTFSKDEFNYLRVLIKSESGISLTEEKTYLIESRLLPIARKLGLSTISELVTKIKTSQDHHLITDVIEAMTTNETSFFRDIKPFEIFKEHVVPRIIENNMNRNFDIWSAACSTGQEPYSLAMTILEDSLRLGNFNTRIKATDIDKTILQKAKDGVYSQFEVQRGLPIMMLMKYFSQQESYGEKWVINDEVKKLITYNQLNLLNSYSSMGKFDVILCRNVLIYFETETKSEILNKLSDCLKSHGLLFLGSAETITDLTDKLQTYNNIHGLYSLRS